MKHPDRAMGGLNNHSPLKKNRQQAHGKSDATYKSEACQLGTTALHKHYLDLVISSSTSINQHKLMRMN